MSRENLEQFIQRILRDPELQEQLRGCSDGEALIRRTLELAAGFTGEEVARIINAAAQQEQQELSFPLDLIPEQSFYCTTD